MLTVGGAVTVTVAVAVEQQEGVAVRQTVCVTVYVPAALQVTPDGFSAVDEDGVPPGKLQAQVTPVIVPVLVNANGLPTHLGELEVKPGVGGVQTGQEIEADHPAPTIVTSE